MQLDLSGSLALLHDTTVRFIETELPLTATRAWHDDPVGFDRAWLRKAAELGWFAMLVPEDDGGGSVSGDGLLDAVIVAESLGRFVQPGPFVPMNVVARAVSRGGSAELRSQYLEAIINGQAVVTWAFADVDGTLDDGAGVAIEAVGDRLRVSGVRGGVQDAGGADALLVVGQMAGEPTLVLVPRDAPGVSVAALGALDLSRRLADVSLDDVVVPASNRLSGAASVDDLLHTAVVLNCAETIGAMDALFAMTVAYAKERVAFGRPIGSFQSLKHVMADQALHLETAKAATDAAAAAVQRGDVGAAAVASMAAACVADIGHDLAQEGLQIHGGIGYTWEHDLHLLMRRIQSNAVLYGSATWHRERLCRLAGLGQDELGR